MPIILRFVHCTDIVSNGILAETGGKYSHVEAVTPDGKLLGAHASGGVMARPSNYDAGTFDRERFLLLTAADEAMAAKFYHYLDAVIGEPYDFGAIAGFVSHLDIHQQHRVICSALRWCGYFPAVLPILAHEVTPRDLELGLIMRPDVRDIARPSILNTVLKAA
jgi:hypothetical protein